MTEVHGLRRMAWPAAIIALVLLVPCGMTVMAQGAQSVRFAPRRSRGRAWRWSEYLSVRSYYDNNILDYSDRDRTLFLARTRPNKFSIMSLDDWVSRVTARIDRRRGSRSRGEYRVRLSASASLFSRNTIKNWSRYELEGRWTHHKKRLIARFSWLPHFYVRDLVVRTLRRPFPASPLYAPASFRRWSADIEYRFPWIGSNEHRLQFSWKRSTYNDLFRPRDNTTWRGRYRWIIPVRKRWKTMLGYEYADVRAAGKDNVTYATDVSRHEQTVSLSLFYRAPRSVSARVVTSYEHQSYTSRKVRDAAHRGRIDDEWRVYVELALPRWKGMRLEVFDRWIKASSTAIGASDVGAYDGNQLGLQVSHAW